MRTRVICCPLCHYITGVASHEYGPENARGALRSHLRRKKHGLSLAEARATAAQQPVLPAIWKGEMEGYEVIYPAQETEEPRVHERVNE